MKNVSIRHFEQLIALERHRHFGRAADSLSMSQPALSRSILTLERNLGVTLFLRTAQGPEPTGSGQLLIKHGRRILAATAELQSEFFALEDKGQIKLSIMCGHYPAELTVPEALSELMRSRPQVQVSMEVTDWIRTAELIEKGVCDLAISELSATSSKIELASELLNDRELFFVVRNGHPLLRLEHPGLDDILYYPWVCSHIPARVAALFGAGPLAAGDFDPDSGNFIPKIIASSVSTAFKLVRENEIVGVAPMTLAYPHLQHGELSVLPFRADWMHLNYGFLWDAQKPLSAVAREFMKHVRAAEVRLVGEEQAMREALGL
jgi:DNA-binding transcriptional LysR family regulator